MIKKIIIGALSASIVGFLAFFAAITVSFVPGVAALYPATGFEAAFGSWFGVWGALGSYFGLLMAGIGGSWFSLPTGLALSVSDFLMALAPAALVRIGKLDPSIRSLNDAVVFVVGTLLLGSLPGSLIYNFINLQIGQISGTNTFWLGVLGWNVGNFFVLLFIGLPLMKLGTPLIRKLDLYIAKWW